MQVRPAQPEDAVRIADLMTQLGYPAASQFIQEKIGRLTLHPDEELAVAVDDGEVLGVISVHFIPQLAVYGDFARISYLCVDESARSRGVGRKMEEWCERIARIRGCDRVEVHCSNHRTEAHRFYYRQGYVDSPKYLIKRIVPDGPEKAARSRHLR